MINKFNIEKFNIMNKLKIFLKYFVITCIMLTLLTSIVQTNVAVRLIVDANFQLDNSSTLTINGADYDRVPGTAFLTVLNSPKVENATVGSEYTESNWGEITDSNENVVEEMEEGAYDSSDLASGGNAWIKYAWEDDDSWKNDWKNYKDGA